MPATAPADGGRRRYAASARRGGVRWRRAPRAPLGRGGRAQIGGARHRRRNEGAYDAVIADNQLPELCGLDVLAALQRARCPVPFILITAFADEDTRAVARALGAAAFLEKPLSIADLQAAVRTAIEPH